MGDACSQCPGGGTVVLPGDDNSKQVVLESPHSAGESSKVEMIVSPPSTVLSVDPPTQTLQNMGANSSGSEQSPRSPTLATLGISPGSGPSLGLGPICELRASLEVHDDSRAAMSAHAKRRAERKAQRAQKTKESKKANILSNLPEVEAEIAYRLKFAVVGYGAEKIMQMACSSESMDKQQLPIAKGRGDGLSFFSRFPFVAGQVGGKNINPNRFSSDVPKLCKSAFSLCTSDVLVCQTRAEAQSCALVCTVLIDPAEEPEKEPSFHQQMLECKQLIDQIYSTKKKLRPQVAMVLYSQKEFQSEDSQFKSEESNVRKATWENRVQEYMSEELWKFGPVDIQNDQEVHAVFAEIASQRILQKDCFGSEDSGASSDEGGVKWGAEEGSGSDKDDGGW